MTEYSAGNKGFKLSKLPEKYKRTPQQEKFANIIKDCGIKKGISKQELQRLMKECVGPRMKKD